MTITKTPTIWRFLLPLDDEPTLRMPTGARVLSVGPSRREPGDYLDLWAVVDPISAPETREFRIVGTGNPLPDDCGEFIGTTHSHGKALIWHVFEVASSEQPS